LAYSFSSLAAPSCRATSVEGSGDTDTGHAAAVEFEGGDAYDGVPEEVVVFAAEFAS